MKYCSIQAKNSPNFEEKYRNSHFLDRIDRMFRIKIVIAHRPDEIRATKISSGKLGRQRSPQLNELRSFSTKN